MFTKETFQFNRGVPNCQATGEGLTSVQHSYISDDTIAVITAPGYFPAHFNEEEAFVVRGDTLLINGSDAIVLVEILDTQTVTLGTDLFTSGTGSILHAPFTVIAGDDISPVPTLDITGITVRGNDPNIGYVAIGGDDTDSMMYAFATKSQGALGHVAMSPVGFLGVLPEIGMFNVYDPLNLRSVILDSTGVFSIPGSAAVDTIDEYTAANGTAINGVVVKGTRITLADNNIYLDNGVSLANAIKLNFSTSNNDFLYYDKVTRTFAYATSGVDQISVSPTETIINNLTINQASINVDTINEFTPAHGIIMADVVKGSAGFQSDIGFDTETAVPFLIAPTNATAITFPDKPVVNFMRGNSNFGIGFDALNGSITAFNNFGVGFEALKSVTTALDNTGIGQSALTANTTGNDNFAVGYEALKSNTTGSGNIGLGWNALGSNTTGFYNIALGIELTLSSNTTGAGNIGLGREALTSNVTGSNNIAIGNEALRANTVSETVGIGQQALRANTTGVHNVAVGYEALKANTTGTDNLALGWRALTANTTGSSNLAIGSLALAANTAGGLDNIAIGVFALTANTTGDTNVAVGVNALASNTTASNNVGIGKNALAANTTGVNNIGIGLSALTTCVAAQYNIAIGVLAQRLNVSGENNIAIGGNALETNSSSNNNIAIGTAALQFNTAANNIGIGANAALLNVGAGNTIIGSNAVAGLLTGADNLLLGNSVGSAYTGAESANILLSNAGVVGESNAIHIGTVGTHTTNFQAGIDGVTVAGAVPVVIGATGQMGTVVSLRSKKENITDIVLDENSEIIKKLQPVKFDYIGHHAKYKQYGLIADDVEKICPELCAYDEKDELKTVYYDKLGIMLLAEVQRLQEKIRILEEKSSCL